MAGVEYLIISQTADTSPSLEKLRNPVSDIFYPIYNLLLVLPVLGCPWTPGLADSEES